MVAPAEGPLRVWWCYEGALSSLAFEVMLGWLDGNRVRTKCTHGVCMRIYILDFGIEVERAMAT